MCTDSCYDAVRSVDFCSGGGHLKNLTWTQRCPDYPLPTGTNATSSISELCSEESASIAGCCWTCLDNRWRRTLFWNYELVWMFLYSGHYFVIDGFLYDDTYFSIERTFCNCMFLIGIFNLPVNWSSFVQYFLNPKKQNNWSGSMWDLWPAPVNVVCNCL